MTRVPLAILSAMLALAGSSLVAASSAPPPPAPSGLSQQAKGKMIPAGSWTKHATVLLSFQISGTGAGLTPRVEVRPAGLAFSNTPNHQVSLVTVASGDTATLSVRVSSLKNGTGYAWQARVVDGQGNAGSWTPFGQSGSTAFRIDTVTPSMPHIWSHTNSRWGGWYRTKVEKFFWTASDSESGIAGFSYTVGHGTDAPRTTLGSSASATLRHLGNGRWVLHVWARDKAGNWSPLAYYPFNINRQAPVAKLEGISRPYYNPFDGKEVWHFKLNRWAHVSVAVARTGLKHPVVRKTLGTLKPGHHVFVWNGRGNHHQVAGKGWYWIRISTRDRLGNHATYAFGGIHVHPWLPKTPFVNEPGKHIVVSLSKQALYAYNGHHLVMQTLVTTGNPALPTPTGHFSIFAKFHPFEFISPWPQGSPYYYPPSWTNYAMEFQSAGYFFHDAPWRSVYGPGSNDHGSPGTNYGGSHGCVNVPFKPA